MPPKALNKRVIESLAAAGAFDCDRAQPRAHLRRRRRNPRGLPEPASRRRPPGQHSLFGSAADAPTLILPAVEPWLPQEKLQKEYDAIGFFLSGHPLDDYAAALKRLRVQSWAEFTGAVKSGATAGKVAATVVSRMERRTKTGNKMGIIGLSDPTGHFEAVLFSEGLAQYRDVLEPGAAVLLQLGAELQGDDVRARILHAEPLDAAAAKTQMGLRIFLRDSKPLESIAKRLEQPAAGSRARGEGLGRAGRESELRQGRRRGHAGDAARPRDRGRDPPARALQGLAADRRRHQGGARRGRRADGLALGLQALAEWACKYGPGGRGLQRRSKPT